MFFALATLSRYVLAADDHDSEFIRSIQRQQQLDNQLLPDSDVRLDRPSESFSYTLSEGEVPCTKVDGIGLAEGADSLFSFLPAEVVLCVARSHDAHCLSSILGCLGLF